MYQSFHRLFQKNIIKLHARFCNSNIQIFSYGSILTFRMPGLWNSQFCLSHIFKYISHILAFTQMYLLIFVFLTIRVSQFQKLPVLVLPVLSFPVGSSQFCLSQFHVVTVQAQSNISTLLYSPWEKILFQVIQKSKVCNLRYKQVCQYCKYYLKY